MTGTTEWTGQRHNEKGGMPSKTRLGLHTSHSRGYLRVRPLDYRVQSDTSVDADPVTLASGGLEFFWSCNAADVGVIGDVRYVEDVHGHSDDGKQ